MDILDIPKMNRDKCFSCKYLKHSRFFEINYCDKQKTGRRIKCKSYEPASVLRMFGR